MLNDGLDAFLCVQNEAVGVDPYTLRTLSAAQQDSGSAVSQSGTDDGAADRSGGASISIASDRQYFEMVRTALIAAERVVAQRLSSAGTPFDAAGVIAEIETLNQKQAADTAAAGTPKEAGQDAKSAANAATPAPPTPPETATLPDGTVLPSRPFVPQGRTAAQQQLAARDDTQVGLTVIRLKTLQTKLDKCVIRAKV